MAKLRRARHAMGRRCFRLGGFVLAGVAALSTSVVALPAPAQAGLFGGSSEYIVSAPSGALGTVINAVHGVGATVGTTFPFVNAVTTQLNSLEVTLLQANPGIVVTPDIAVNVQGSVGSSGHDPSDAFSGQTGAAQLWAQGITGAGVNVAVLDTGVQALPDFSGRMVDGVDLSGGNNPWQDDYGHGTFVAGLIAGNGASSNGAYTGEAPGAGLVSVKVAGASGQTDLANVIAGVGWTIANRSADNISVLNMSLGYLPIASTVVDPLDQAVEQAWESGITVVTSAGNSGPGNGTVTSPGDDPLVITVGSVDDGAQANPANDTMTTFSSVGPTNPDGWFKPDLVTSGRSVVSLRDPGSTIDAQNPSARVGSTNFVGSGTSFSAAVTSGAAALLISADPSYTPNTVKGTLLGTTMQGPVGNPFVDGHGILNVAAAGQLGADDAEPARAHGPDAAWRHGRPRGSGCHVVVERRQLDRLPLERLPLERLDLERLPLERFDLERLHLERLGLERLDLEWLPLERLDLERLDLERLDLEWLPLERLDLELI